VIRSAFTKNIPLKLASLFLALVLWTYVIDQSENIEESNLSVEVQMEGLDSRLVQISPSESERKMISVTVTGPRKVDTEMTSEFKAHVDLSRFKIGDRKGKCLIILDVPPTYAGAEWKCEPSPRAIDVLLDESYETKVKVVLRTSGLLKESYIYAGSTLSPNDVSVRGAKQYVNSVKQVRAILDLSNTEPTRINMVKLEALDSNGKPVSGVVCDPDTVAVRPALMVAPPTKNVVITPNYLGTAAIGYRITSCEVTPNQVRLKGSSEVLAGLVSVDTQPIKIQDLNSDATFAVRLKLPKDVRELALDGSTKSDSIVQVRFKVERIQ
jgi:YbbR domain-containing protein